MVSCIVGAWTGNCSWLTLAGEHGRLNLPIEMAKPE